MIWINKDEYIHISVTWHWVHSKNMHMYTVRALSYILALWYWSNVPLSSGHVSLHSVSSKHEVSWAFQLRHNEHDGGSNHQPHDCVLNRLFKRRSKKTSKLCVTGVCVGNSAVTGEFPAQRASDANNVSIWWRHHGLSICGCCWPFRNELWIRNYRQISNLRRTFVGN